MRVGPWKTQPTTGTRARPGRWPLPVLGKGPSCVDRGQVRARHRSWSGSARELVGGPVGALEWQADREGAPAALAAAHPDRAAVLLDDLARAVKPHAGAGDPAGRVRPPLEALEHQRQALLRDAHARVGD